METIRRSMVELDGGMQRHKQRIFRAENPYLPLNFTENVKLLQKKKKTVEINESIYG